MSVKSNPLADIGTAHEEEFFRKENHELLEKMRKQRETQNTAAAIEEKTGASSPELATFLSDKGIDAEMLPVLHLLPLVQVAWADGEIQDEERTLLMSAANLRGISEDHPAHAKLLGWLAKPPSAALYDAALTFIRLVLASQDDADAQESKSNLENLTVSMADAAGGFMGMFGRTSSEETAVLEKIAKRLSTKS
jgi:hypothetical protein